MRNKSIFILIAMLILSSLSLSSCNILADEVGEEVSESVIQTYVAQTLAAQGGGEPEEEPPPEPTAVATATAFLTVTMTPTLTEMPTETLTPTPSEPLLHVDVNTNCRLGPGELYDIRGALLADEEAKVVGAYREGDFWVIENPDGSGECWVWGYYATLEGPLDDLPYYTQPPTPTPDVDWSGTWTTLFESPPESGSYVTYTVTVDQMNSVVMGSYEDHVAGVTVDISGDLSDDLMTLSGTWDNGTITGTFLWHWLNPNQFNGNQDAANAWCGYRAGAGQPSPCYYP